MRVEYVKKQGAEVEEPEITEVLLTPEPEEVLEPEVVEPELVEEEEEEPELVEEEDEEPDVVEEEPEPEPEEPEAETEVIPPTNDFTFVEPEQFRVQGQLLSETVY